MKLILPSLNCFYLVKKKHVSKEHRHHGINNHPNNSITNKLLPDFSTKQLHGSGLLYSIINNHPNNSITNKLLPDFSTKQLHGSG
jgi:hypothetical protein